MSTTFRFFVNNKRMSTAVRVKEGYILQVYPMKRRFADEGDWQAWWTLICKPSIRVEGPSAPPPSPVVSLLASIPVRHRKPMPSVKESDWSHRECSTFTAPPGTYYIGDLCYVLSDPVYETIFGGLGGYDNGLYKETRSDRFFFLSNTAYGDGIYCDNEGREYTVDAGIIGICPSSLMFKNDGGGQMHTFSDAVVCKSKNGIFTFTSGLTTITINTQGQADDDDV